MAEKTNPHFQNDAGVQVIYTGAKEIMCIGATPPFDHPHEFLDMGAENEIVCPYCSTLFRYRSDLHADQAEPASALWVAQSDTPFDLEGARGSGLR